MLVTHPAVLMNISLSLSDRRSVVRWTLCLRSCCLVSLLQTPQVRALIHPLLLLLSHPSHRSPPPLLDLQWRREASACAAEASSNPRTNRTEGESIWVLGERHTHHRYEFIFPDIQYICLFLRLINWWISVDSDWFQFCFAWDQVVDPIIGCVCVLALTVNQVLESRFFPSQWCPTCPSFFDCSV